MATTLRSLFWPNWQQRRRLLRREAWLVVVAAYPLLAFARLWPQDWQNSEPHIVLIGLVTFLLQTLQFHLGLLLLLIFAVASFRGLRRLSLVALPPLAWTLGPTLLSFVPRDVPPPADPPLRVMSVNLLMVNQQTGGILDEVAAAQPDVICLQEYTDHWHAAFQARFGTAYPYASVVTREDSFGIAVYSRRPFAKAVREIRWGDSGVEQLRAEIDVGGRRFAFYNIHLLPPRSMLYYTDHRMQFVELLEALRSEELPYLICGDYNFCERSPQHRELKSIGVGEAHEQAASGRGATWPVNGFLRYVVPGIRIDHVYLSPALRATTCKTGVGEGSDHRPIVVDVATR